MLLSLPAKEIRLFITVVFQIISGWFKLATLKLLLDTYQSLLPDAGLDIPLPEMRKRRVEVICATFLNPPPGQIAAEIGLLKFILEITVSTTKPRTYTHTPPLTS